MDTNKLTKAYVALRDAKAELTKEFNVKDAEIKAKLDLLEGQMLKFLIDTGTDSVRTPNGTFFKQEEITPAGEDWDAFYKWVAKNDAFDFLERRIKKTAVKEYMESNKGKIPPGVSVYREFVVRVRRT